MTSEQEPECDWRDQWAHNAITAYGLGAVVGPIEGAHARFEEYMREIDRVGYRQAKENWLARESEVAGGTDNQQGD